MEEDILLLKNSLIHGTKWAQVSKGMQGRNQHQVKNRFIYLLKEINHISRENIRSLIKKNNVHFLVEISLNYLQETDNLLNFIKNEEEKQEFVPDQIPLNHMPEQMQIINQASPIMMEEEIKKDTNYESMPGNFLADPPKWDYIQESFNC